MFISFLIPSVFESVRARHLLVFYKQLAAFGRDQVAFVGESDYFRPPVDLRAEGRPEWNESWRAAFDYEPPEDLDGVKHRTLPRHLFAARLARLQSSWRLYGQLATRRLPELETAFSAALDSLSGEGTLEGVLAFANNPSVAHVARLRGLPVIHTEFGPLRKPAYVMTSYWDTRGVSLGTDAARRFRLFRSETARTPVPLLTRQELLWTLRRTELPDGPDAAAAPFRVGVALQGEDSDRVQGIGALDLLSCARRHARREEILVRYHSGGVARYADTFGTADRSADATEFIQQCQTILTVSSGTALEALLLDRRCVVLGDSPFRLAADRSLDTVASRGHADRLPALNFLVFGYLVPGALMFDPDYVRWRLTNPSEIEIYCHHQRWHRTQRARCGLSGSTALALSAAAKLLHAVPHRDAPEPLMVFGAGQSTPALIERLQPARFALLGVFDNDTTKWGNHLAGLTIGPPVYRDDATVLVSSLVHGGSIVTQLQALGYPPERILTLR